MSISSLEPIDRRKEPRVGSVHLVHVEEYWYPPGANHRTDEAIGRTLDLSRAGLRLELDRPLHPCSRVRLDLALRDALLRLEGRIRWVRETDPGRHEMGIELALPGPEEADALEAFLRLRGGAE